MARKNDTEDSDKTVQVNVQAYSSTRDSVSSPPHRLSHSDASAITQRCSEDNQPPARAVSDLARP